MPGWKSLIVCSGVKGEVGPAGNILPECSFASLIELIKVVIHDLVLISTLLAVVAFIYAGIVLLTSGGNSSAMTKAKGIFWNVLIGYLWILAAWLVVYTITSVLLNPGYSLLGPPTKN